MKKRFILTFAIVLLFSLFASPVRADMGPKPSVHITFQNPAEEPYYVVLLSERESYGPWSANAPHNINDPEVLAFLDSYKDPDGFYMIGNGSEVRGNSYSWTYYPPQTFKILVYYPASRTSLVTDIQERYAFDSYYSVDLATGEVKRTPSYSGNLIGFAVRVVLTILIEALIAFLFGYRASGSFRLILIVNLITQILLNAVMGILDYTSGMLVWLLLFPLAELAVIVAEALIYGIALKEKSRGRAVLYAVIANLVTAVLGFYTGLLIG